MHESLFHNQLHIHRHRKILKVGGGGGALDNTCQKLGPYPSFRETMPIGVDDAVRLLWQEFLDYSNEDTNSKVS